MTQIWKKESWEKYEGIMKEVCANYEGDLKGTWRKYENNWKYMFKIKRKKHVIFSIPVEFCKWESSGAWRTQGSWLHSLHLARFAGVHWRTPSMSETSWSLSSMAKLQDPGPRTGEPKIHVETDSTPIFECEYSRMSRCESNANEMKALACHHHSTVFPVSNAILVSQHLPIILRPLKWPKCLKFPTHISWSDVSWSWCTLQTVWNPQPARVWAARCSAVHLCIQRRFQVAVPICTVILYLTTFLSV